MENKKIIYRLFIFYSIFFLIGCISDENSKLSPINGSILYTQENYKKAILKQGLNYYNEIAILKDSLIYNIEDVVDINSFQLIQGTKCYYYDKNRTYAFQSDRKASYPKFVEIEIDLRKLTIIDSVTIKDNHRQYFEGFLVEHSQAIEWATNSVRSRLKSHTHLQFTTFKEQAKSAKGYVFQTWKWNKETPAENNV